MAKIKKYTKKDGSTAYEFCVYLGVNPKNGKPRKTTRRGFKTKKDANLALARIMTGDDKPQTKGTITKKYITFKDVYDLWIETYVYTVKETTFAKVKGYFSNHILPDMGQMVVKNITFVDCQKVINEWYEKSTVYKSYKSYAGKIFKHAIKMEIISENPMDLVDVPKAKKRKKKDTDLYYSQSELNEFLTWIRNNQCERNYMAIRILAFTGIRRGELAGLMWEDVDFEKSTLSINKSVVRLGNQQKLSDTKTNSSKRVISLDQETLYLLKRWKLNQKKELLSKGLIVKKDTEQSIVSTTTSNGLIYPEFCREIMKRYPNNKLSPHGLRHTHATLLLQSGVHIKDVQFRLGHANVTTTLNIYGHHSKDDKHIVDNLSDKLIGSQFGSQMQ